MFIRRERNLTAISLRKPFQLRSTSRTAHRSLVEVRGRVHTTDTSTTDSKEGDEMSVKCALLRWLRVAQMEAVRRTSVALLAILSLFFASSFIVPTVADAADYGQCGPTLQTRIARAMRQQSTGTGGTNPFDGVYAETPYLRLPHSCIAGTGDHAGHSLVIAANLSNGSGLLVQLGWGHFDCPSSGPDCGIPRSQDGYRFFYTVDPLSGGQLAVFPGAEVPQVGHRYSFKITTDSLIWTYTIRDITDNQSWTVRLRGARPPRSDGRNRFVYADLCR